LVSCGDGGKPKIKKVPLTKVTGKVTVDGAPQPLVVVTFIPTGPFEPSDRAQTLVAVSDEQGNYAPSTYEMRDGLPAGEYGVIFSWTPVPPLRLGQSDEDQPEPTDKLNGKYSDRENPPLKIKVESGKPLVIDVMDLKTS